MTGPFVFVDIDTQRDFLEPGGSLFLEGSAFILENLRRLTSLARTRHIPIVATACAHTIDEDDPEPFPPHCLMGTPGQARIEPTAWTGPDGLVLHLSDPFTMSEQDPVPPHLTLEKQRYDVFTRPEARQVFEWYARRLQNPLFVVYGVATDYCVACATRGLLAHGHRVALVADAVHPVDPSHEADIFTELAARGALLTTTEVVASWIG